MARLLFLTERYPPDLGGVAVSSSRTARALAGLGYQVDVIAWTRHLPAGTVVHDDGNPALYRMGRFRAWDSTMPHTANLLDSFPPHDIVWGHYLNPAGFLAVWYAKLRGIRSIVSARGNDLDRDMFPPGDFARLRWTVENAGTVATVTRELGAKVAALCGRTDAFYLPNAVDSSMFCPADPADLRMRLGIRPEEAVLGFAGELREKKGQHFLVEALKAVQKVRPACLLVIGEVRPSELPRVLQVTGPGTLEEHRIVVTGQLSSPEQVNLHLNACDVYLQPSLWDGMPNALLEAMSAGCFCIGSDAGGIPEIIRDGIDGVVLKRWELARLGREILKWLDLDRSELRRAARATAVEQFSFERERAALQSIIDR